MGTEKYTSPNGVDTREAAELSCQDVLRGVCDYSPDPGIGWDGTRARRGRLGGCEGAKGAAVVQVADAVVDLSG